ncbi:MAG: hypothetical protein WCG48_01845 [Candidatus Berkelbacteria bacterium]
MRDFFRQPIFLLFIIIAIVVAVGWNIWSNRKTTPATTTATSQSSSKKIEDLTNIDPADFNEPTKNELNLAYQKAQEVNPEYKLSALEIEFDSTMKADTVVSRYIFSSEADTTNNWIFTVSGANGNYIRALIPKNDYQGNISTIDLAKWKFNYVTAFQLAEENGGRNWRENNKNLQKVILTLRNTSDNWLTWTITYYTADSTYPVNIDAYSGKML